MDFREMFGDWIVVGEDFIESRSLLEEDFKRSILAKWVKPLFVVFLNRNFLLCTLPWAKFNCGGLILNMHQCSGRSRQIWNLQRQLILQHPEAQYRPRCVRVTQSNRILVGSQVR